jgi:hypothetical protein
MLTERSPNARDERQNEDAGQDRILGTDSDPSVNTLEDVQSQPRDGGEPRLLVKTQCDETECSGISKRSKVELPFRKELDAKCPK